MDTRVDAASSHFRRPDDPSRLSPVVLTGAISIVEGTLTALMGFLVYYIYLSDQADISLSRYALVIVLAAQAQVAAFGSAGLYNVAAFRRPLRLGGRILVLWTGLFAAMMGLAFLTKTGEDFSRVWLTAWFFNGFILILAVRIALSALMHRWRRSGRLEQRVAIIGADERAEKLIEAFEASSDSDIRVMGVFDDRTDRVPDRVRNYPVVGSIKSLLSFARQRRVDVLILALPNSAEKRILQLVKQLHELPVDIRLSAHTNTLRLAPHTYSWIGNVPMLDICDRPVADWGHVLKAIEDRVLAAFFLLLALPVFAAVAAAIKLDSKGPVFFKQKRFGFNNDLTEVYKFRTLRVDMTDQNANKLVTANDPRVTWVGKFLRRTSLDELPQLISVLKGGMSIVGPRPHAIQAKAGSRLYQEVVDGYYSRHRVKPGITGWAQINGWRGETDTEEKIMRRTEHDLYYIDHWSIWFDLYIIAKTPLALLRGENAY